MKQSLSTNGLNSESIPRTLLNRKGILIPVVAGILGILGLIFFSLHWMSRNRNLQAHKITFNEVARCLSEGGYQLLSRAIREGIQTPDESSLRRWIASGGSLDMGFYGRILKSELTASKQGTRPNHQLSHTEILRLAPSHFEKILENLQSKYPGAEISLSMEWSSQHLFEEKYLLDLLEKEISLILTSSCTYQGTRKSVTGIRKLRAYNLLTPLLSKFTFYHKSQSGNTYNQFLSNIFGRPVIRADGKFKYPNNHFPLVLINGPLNEDSEFIPDSVLLGSRGKSSNPDSFEYLSDPSQIKASREAILRRGFLYFGPTRGDSANVLNLTPGADPLGFGEYFFLFNPYFGEDGPRTYPAIQFVDLPPAFEEPVPVENIMDPAEGLPFESNGKADIYSLHEGFYESDPTNEFAPNPRAAGYIKNGYSEASSLIHPFGTYTMPSRAYTMGSGFRAVAKLSSIGIDRDESSTDESQQSNCLGSPAPRRDATAAFLYQTNESGFLNPIPNITLAPIHHTLDNRNYVPDCSEPRRLRLPSDFDYPKLFPEFDLYQLHMSHVLYIPMNHILDYPHFSHRVIPPPGHENFQSFMFPPHEPESLYALKEPFYEEWPIPKGPLHKEGSFYLKGNPDEFEPDLWLEHKVSFELFDMKEMIAQGFLQENGDQYILDTRGHLLSLAENLYLDKPLLVVDHANLFVRGDCILPPIESAFYVQISCNGIQLKKDTRKGNSGVYRAFLNARNSLGKMDLDLAVSVVGGIAMRNLDFSMFQAPSMVTYNTDFSPVEDGRDYFYRILMDDHTQSWRTEI